MSWFLYCTIGFFVGMFFTLFVVALCNAASSPVHDKLELLVGEELPSREIAELYKDNPQWFIANEDKE